MLNGGRQLRRESYLQQMPQQEGNVLDELLLLKVNFANSRVDDGSFFLPTTTVPMRNENEDEDESHTITTIISIAARSQRDIAYSNPPCLKMLLLSMQQSRQREL